ncbi:MAG: Ku protein [Candidatus Dormibacteria bacterium]
MPSATWRGTVSFGLVAIPVRMYRATESGGVSFRMLCSSCGSPIQNRRWCPQEEKLIDWGAVERGFEVSRGEFVEVTDQDLERLPLPSTDTIEVLEVVAEAEIDPALYVDQAYYLEPEPAGVRPYALLRQALQQTGRSAVGKIALRQREHLCRLAARDQVLVLNTLHWPDEIRTAASLKLPDAKAEVGKRELGMAVTLLDNLSASFDPGRYQDQYREALQQVVEAKRERRALPEARPQPRGDNVVDLMAALKAAVEQTRPDGKRSRVAERPAPAPTRRPARAAASGQRRRAS